MPEHLADRSDDHSTVIPEAASRAAEEVLLDQRRFDLDDERYRTFIDLLDEPPQENGKLRALMRTSRPWSTEEINGGSGCQPRCS